MTILFGPLGPTLAPQIRSSKTIYRWFKPFADWYAQISGYRQMGLKYDDLRMSSPSLFMGILSKCSLQSLRSAKMSRG